MNGIGMSRPPVRVMGGLFAVIGLILSVMVFVAPAARAQDDAQKILKAMSAYVVSQKFLAVTFDTDIEVITPEVQKLQFTSSGKVLLSRPDKLRASRTGGYVDVELVFDGKMLTIFGKDAKAYAQAEAPGTIDQLVDRLRNQYLVDIPGADIILSNAHDAMMEEVIDAKYIGHGVIDGIECDHLAFRNQDTDWQIWIERGEHPIPRKYIITSKAVAAAPQYTLRIKEWQTDQEASADAFAFRPPDDAQKVDFAALPNIDEVPAGTVKGGEK
jgi:hypothetical protein